MSNSGENKGISHVKLGIKFRVEQASTQTQVIRHFGQEARSTEHVEHFLSSHPLVS